MRWPTSRHEDSPVACVLLTGDGYTPRHLEQLSMLGLDVIHRIELDKEELESLLPSVDIHILGGSERITSESLSIAHRLRMISFVGVGVGAFVDVTAAATRGVQIAHTPGLM